MRRSASMVVGGHFDAGRMSTAARYTTGPISGVGLKGRSGNVAIFALYIRFTQNTERRLETRPVHREYLKSLYDAGKLLESGPFTDDSGALIIYEVPSREAAEAQFAADPYSTTGGIVESVTFHEWNRVFPPPA
jgi:uncharacterized protein YciI